MVRRNEADELDRLVDARRGERPAPDEPAGADLDRLVAAADRLTESWQQSPSLDERAVWARVGTALRTTPQRGGRMARWPRPPAGVWTVPWRAAATASAVAIVGLVFALLAPGDSSAAFVADVERLSTTAADALADEELTAAERTGLAALANTLFDRINQDPRALAELDSDELEAVAVALSTVEQRLVPHAEAATAPPPAEAPSAANAGGAASPAATLPAERAPAPAAAEPLVAVRSVSGAVEQVRASRGLGPSGAPGLATAGTLCGGADGSAAAVCGAAVQTALSICGGVTNQSGLAACEAAVDVAEHSCDLVQGPERSACRIALRDLARSAGAGLAPSGGNGSRGAVGDEGGPPGRRRGNE